MANYEHDSATNALRSYIWKLLEANLGWKKEDYKGMVPIFPISQEPEPKEIGRAFLVFNSSLHSPEHLYVLKTESIGYTIYASTANEAEKIARLLADTFDRQDEAADDVNQWLNTEAAATGKHRNISFATIKTTMIDNVDAADNEGGYVASLVVLEVRYVNQNNTITTADFTYP